MIQSIKDAYTLRNKVKIPGLAFGTAELPDGPAAVEAIKKAIAIGYRHFDTAAVYGNEESVGKAIRESGIPRKEFFVTSKLRNPDQGCEFTINAFELTMNLIDLEYLDLYLIHWPIPKGRNDDYKQLNLSSWRAFEYFYKQGLVKAIGVCNFMEHHLTPLLERSTIPPMINQIECHPGHYQKAAVEFSQKNGLVVEAWAPLGHGKVLQHPVLGEIAARYKKTVAQLCIRWCIQKDMIPLPKSAHEDRIKANIDVFDFNISDEDIARIDSLPSCGWSGFDPENVPFYV